MCGVRSAGVGRENIVAGTNEDVEGGPPARAPIGGAPQVLLHQLVCNADAELFGVWTMCVGIRGHPDHAWSPSRDVVPADSDDHPMNAAVLWPERFLRRVPSWPGTLAASRQGDLQSEQCGGGVRA